MNPTRRVEWLASALSLALLCTAAPTSAQDAGADPDAGVPEAPADAGSATAEPAEGEGEGQAEGEGETAEGETAEGETGVEGDTPEAGGDTPEPTAGEEDPDEESGPPDEPSLQVDPRIRARIPPPGTRLPPELQRPPAPPPRTEGPQRVTVYRDDRGFKLQVDGNDFMVLGMNWSYVPIGENYSYSLWDQSEEIIEEALNNEMELLRDMGINAIRVYVGIPQRWITWIYQNYGIYTILNHSMGRYGHNIDGVWRAPTNYEDGRTREVISEEINELVEQYRDTPGLLMWLLGNENNYGLFWAGGETEDLPEEAQGEARARFLYSLFGEIIDNIHERDPNHPVAIANGDLQYIELIRELAPNLDIMGSNVYRGASSRDLFDRVAEVLDVPFVYTEFGADAWNAREGREDDMAQAEVDLALWQEIFEHAYGLGRAQNAIGGMTFQWSDGWWKYRQTENLDVHDRTASWSNAAYQSDYQEGQNNMNEEWFGICAKGRPDSRGIFRLYPRTAYYVLRDAYRLDPYAESITLQRIRAHFGAIRPRDASTNYAAAQAMNRIDELEMVRMAFMRVDLDTYTTGGSQLNDEPRNATRFDSTQSFYFGFELQPNQRMRANLTLNVLGNVAQNPINEIFYENRGIPRTFADVEGEEVTLASIDRIAVYQSSFRWEESWFQLDGYYRVGQNHWGYDGDFFNLVPETHYGPNLDLFNAQAPIGFTFNGRRELEGLRVAFGPELWWGANPTIIAMYHREIGPWEFSLMHQEDFAQRDAGQTSSAVPTPQDRRTTIYLSRTFGPLRIEIGGIMAGSPRVGREYQAVRDAPENGPSYLGSGYYVIDDQIRIQDTFGAKARIRLDAAPFFWYLQGGYRGLVADGGWDATTTITGWSMKESGQGNHWAVSTGAALNIGDFQIAPNFLVQQPLEGPLPQINDFFDRATGIYYPGLNGRNQLQDPFWVRSNRETYGFELLIAFDPTPSTWMWAWDNVAREDAPFAAFLDLSYRIHPTSQDAGVGVSAEGFQFAFPTGAPAQDLYDARLRTVFNFSRDVRLVNTAYFGNGQANGDDDRLVFRGGIEGRLAAERFVLNYFFRIGDWGPYDYYRDFNQTFPFQGMVDMSYGLVNPQWFVSSYTRFGVRGTFRALDANSGRYQPDPSDPDALGTEWEVRTYVQLSL